MSESFSDTIKPKSDQLNADDLLVSPITVTITDVKRGPVDQPVHIHIDGQQPFKPCKSMRRVIIAAWGDIGANWIGKSMTLYCDPSVKFGGVALGGIRISHMSDIGRDLSIMLTASRGKKSGFTVKKIEPVKVESVKLDENTLAWIAAYKRDPGCVNELDNEFKQLIIRESKSV